MVVIFLYVSCVGVGMWFSSSQRDMKESFSSAKMYSINIFLSFRCGLMRKCCSELFSSVQFSCSVVSDSLRPHGLQHARLPCPLLTPRVYPNSCPLSQWCHPMILSSVVLFCSCLQSFPPSGSFLISQFLSSGGQSTGVSSGGQSIGVELRTEFNISPSNDY